MFCVLSLFWSFTPATLVTFRHPVAANGIPATPTPHPLLPSSRGARSRDRFAPLA
jgi:hypothetical protein